MAAHRGRRGVRRTEGRPVASELGRDLLVAYEVDESSGGLVVNILGVFHGGQDGRPRSAKTRAIRGRADDAFVRVKCVQESQRRPFAINGRQRVCAGQPHNAIDDREQPLSVPSFPWYY